MVQGCRLGPVRRLENQDLLSQRKESFEGPERMFVSCVSVKSPHFSTEPAAKLFLSFQKTVHVDNVCCIIITCSVWICF